MRRCSEKVKMQKISITLLIIIIAVGVAVSLLFSPERLFKTHVLPEIPTTIKNLNHYQDHCAMHGPLIFAFEAEGQDIQEIIQNNDLKKYEEISAFAASLLTHMDSHHLSWWKSLGEIKQMEIYGKRNRRAATSRILNLSLSKKEIGYIICRYKKVQRVILSDPMRSCE